MNTDGLLLNREIGHLLLALLAGVLLGVEREYKNKYAGIRTIALITLGSCLFTILSGHIGGGTDRVASNILTGIGFIGAGVIFKNDVSLSGLTTAATIWIAAAIGMAIGSGNIAIAFCSLAAALFALILLKYLQVGLNKLHQVRVYHFSFDAEKMTVDGLEAVFREHKILFKRLKEYRSVDKATCLYELTGRVSALDEMNNRLMREHLIDAFNY